MIDGVDNSRNLEVSEGDNVVWTENGWSKLAGTFNTESQNNEWELVVSRIHSGNKEIYPTALDKLTGYFTCENHGLVEGEYVTPFESMTHSNASCYIPYELFVKCAYNSNMLRCDRQLVTVIDENTFALKDSKGNIITYTASQNSAVNVANFHFENQDGTKLSTITNLDINLDEYDVMIVGENYGQRVNL